jgi:hypothetical protein
MREKQPNRARGVALKKPQDMEVSLNTASRNYARREWITGFKVASKTGQNVRNHLEAAPFEAICTGLGLFDSFESQGVLVQ